MYLIKVTYITEHHYGNEIHEETKLVYADTADKAETKYYLHIRTHIDNLKRDAKISFENLTIE